MRHIARRPGRSRRALQALLICVAASAVSIAATSIALRRDPSSPAEVAVTGYRAGLSRLDSALGRLDAALAATDAAAARRTFRETRAAYKRIELFVEYFGQFTARGMNGPPLLHAEDEDPETPLAPAGLQVIEADVFPSLDAARALHARREIPFIRTAIAQLRAAGTDTMPGDAFLFDALRHEIARVATLGIAGFDATVSGDAIVEVDPALEGVRDAIGPYRNLVARRDRVALDTLDARFAAAIAFARTHPAFERFDRLRFIASYVQPLAHALAATQRALAIGSPPRPRSWSARAASIYDAQAFDPMYFAATDARPAGADVVALGRELFFDPSLSPSGTRSCATCHVPERAFTDGRPRALLIAGHVARGGGRNTPTLLNAGLQPTLFDDGRVRTLEDQATDVLGSPGEMGGSLEQSARLLRGRQPYVDRFARAFPGPRDSALTPQTVRLALAGYVRSLVSLESRFDRAVRGDTALLTTEERRGFDLFMGKGRCGTCHFAPLFNGAMPPVLFESEPEVIGVPARDVQRGAVVDPDSGRFNVRRIDLHLYAFKTPSIRNVELTGPYMHNGVFRTLDDVVRFYDGGGGKGIGIDVRQTLPFDALHLSADERAAIVAFMKTLTDTVGTTARP